MGQEMPRSLSQFYSLLVYVESCMRGHISF